MADWKSTFLDLFPKEFIKVEITVINNPTIIIAPGATIGNLNTGEQKNIGSINAHIGQLSGDDKAAAEALKALAEAFVSKLEGLSDNDKSSGLEWLAVLAEQSTVPEPERRTSIIKTALDTLAGISSAAGGLATAWSQWGPALMKFFGV